MNSAFPLQGEELLTAWRNFASGKKSELVRACGYVTKKKDGSERLNFQAFYEALAKAKQSPNASDEKAVVSEEDAKRIADENAILRLRKLAQRKLKDGKPLTEEELVSLPDFQRKALERNGKQATERAVKKMAGKELYVTVMRLAEEGMAEPNIAIKCGYNPDDIGLFRRELSRFLGAPIAPLARLLINGLERDPSAFRNAGGSGDMFEYFGNQNKLGLELPSDSELESQSGTTPREFASSLVSRRIRSNRFRQEVMRAHGSVCACCSMDIIQLLEAAHIRPVEHDGSDHVGNGMPLCPTHHLAFDRHLFCLNHQSGEIVFSPGISPSKLGIEKMKISLSLSSNAVEYRYGLFVTYWSLARMSSG